MHKGPLSVALSLSNMKGPSRSHMRHPHLIGLLLIWITHVPAIGYPQGTGASNAIPVTLPFFQDAWMLEGKMGERLRRPRQGSGCCGLVQFQTGG